MFRLMTIACFLALSLLATGQTLQEVRNMPVGSTTPFSGTVTSVDEFGLLSFIQDETGAIAVFDSSFSTMVEVGDVVHGEGTLQEYGATHPNNGLLELVDVSLESLQAGQPVPTTHVLIDSISEDQEGMLISCDVTPQWTSPGCMQHYTNIALRDANVTLWIDGNTRLAGMPIPATTCTVTGFVTEWEGQRQIMPRYRRDIALHTTHSSVFHTNILSLNTWFLGSDSLGPQNDTLQVELLRDLIVDHDVGIVTLQEVQNRWAVEYLQELLPSFEAAHRDPLLFQNNVTLHDASRLSRVDWFELETPGRGWAGGRRPLVTDFVDDQWNAIRIVNIHAKSGNELEDWNWRSDNAQELLDSAVVWQDRAVVVVGDFNDEIGESIVSGSASPYAGWFESGEFSTAHVEQLGYTYLYSGNTIDHVFLLHNGRNATASTRVLYPVVASSYCSQLSDHLPVLTELGFSPPSSVDESLPTDVNAEVHVYTLLGKEILRGTKSFVQRNAPRNTQLILQSAAGVELVVFH